MNYKQQLARLESRSHLRRWTLLIIKPIHEVHPLLYLILLYSYNKIYYIIIRLNLGYEKLIFIRFQGSSLERALDAPRFSYDLFLLYFLTWLTKISLSTFSSVDYMYQQTSKEQITWLHFNWLKSWNKKAYKLKYFKIFKNNSLRKNHVSESIENIWIGSLSFLFVGLVWDLRVNYSSLTSIIGTRQLSNAHTTYIWKSKGRQRLEWVTK